MKLVLFRIDFFALVMWHNATHCRYISRHSSKSRNKSKGT